MDPHEEQALLDRARQGDRRALDTLLVQLQPSVYKFGLKMCRDDETAREVLQETLLSTVRHLSSFRGDSSLTTWLYTIARSVCIKQRRRSKFAPAALEPLEAAAEAEAASAATGTQPERPDESLERSQLGRRLEQAIAGLEPMYRDVLVLRDVEGLSAAEVAEALELSVEAVKSRLHRARTRVRDVLAPALTAAAPPGPSCPDVAALLSAKLEGDIAAATCKEMEQHLLQCPSCTAVCDSLRQTLRMCSAVRREVPAELQDSVRRAVQQFLAVHPG
ncbi:MAG TPA: sigma-70 family RNA polymerase sigma factor [Polyangia bacterium]|jgi:RNA polymerase sigma-70 factor (ECF subfamily)